MTVPGFQTWFLPMLKHVGDGQTHKLATLYEELAGAMQLSVDDLQEMLPSGKQLIYKNRIGWARTYLTKAGLLEAPARGQVRITTRGLEVLSSQPAAVNVSFLKQYQEFRDFHEYKGPSTAAPGTGTSVDEGGDTPEEALEKAHLELREGVSQELLSRLKASPPEFFEYVVVELLLRMGYGGSRKEAGKTLGRSNDGGVDGVIAEDRLGLDQVYIQAKRWEGTVGRPVVQAFAGSLDGVRARKGVVLTTSSFSSGALEYAAMIEKSIVLVDGEQLVALMFEHNLGVSPVSSYEVKRVDLDFFEDS
jgi:restriction system protein